MKCKVLSQRSRELKFAMNVGKSQIYFKQRSEIVWSPNNSSSHPEDYIGYSSPFVQGTYNFLPNSNVTRLLKLEFQLEMNDWLIPFVWSGSSSNATMTCNDFLYTLGLSLYLYNWWLRSYFKLQPNNVIFNNIYDTLDILNRKENIRFCCLKSSKICQKK